MTNTRCVICCAEACSKKLKKNHLASFINTHPTLRTCCTTHKQSVDHTLYSHRRHTLRIRVWLCKTTPLKKQAPSCNSPHNWLIVWLWIQLVYVICGVENGTNGHHLVVNNFGVVFAHNFLVPHYPFPRPQFLSSISIGAPVVLVIPAKTI